MSKDDEEMTVTCPKCKRRVKVRIDQAEAKSKVVCACGESIELVKAL
jgi:hypothetical protein